MGECMEFPDTVEEFMEQYKLVDTEEVYSNGCEFVPIFRMKQWLEHQTDRMKLVQEAVNTLMNSSETNSVKDKCFRNAARFVQNAIDGEPQDFERIPDEPEIMPDGTLHITVITDVADIDRILLSQAGTHSGDLYYKDDEKPEPQWIPVTERLPEPRMDVWVNSDIGQIQGYYEENVKIWYASFGQGRDYLELIVNAWMPLPEPYKEKVILNDRY